MFRLMTTVTALVLVFACAKQPRYVVPEPPRPVQTGERSLGVRFPQYGRNLQTIPNSSYTNRPVPFITTEKLRNYLKTRFADKKTSVPEIVIEDETESHLRLIVKGAKREVIRDNDYWELLYMDFWLQRRDTRARGVYYGQFPMMTLDTSIAAVFDLALVVSGRYAAGGKPDKVQDYTRDFVAEGFSDELDFYGSRILDDVIRRFQYIDQER